MRVTRLPGVFEFRLPPGWEPVADPPEDTFAALHVASAPSGFTANITVSAVDRPDVRTLAEIAEETVARLRTGSPDLRVVDRAALADGFAQQVTMTAQVNGRSWDVVRSEVYTAAVGRDEQAVLCAVLTCAVNRFAEVIGDFDAFLSTLHFVSVDEDRR